MSYLTKNRLDAELTATQIEAVKGAFDTIKENLPFLVGLTKEERMQLPKINVDNKVFTEDTIAAGRQNAEMLPASFGTAGIEKDLRLFTELDALAVQSRQITELLEDTAMLAGSEAYVGALALYKFFGAAADSGMPGADSMFDHLKGRFTARTPAAPQVEGTGEAPKP